MAQLKDSNSNEISPPSKRYLSIDVFKGMTILLMAFVNTLSPFDDVPSWSKHAIDYGLTYVDFIAPFFVFMMALNFKNSYYRRMEKNGRTKTILHFLGRCVLFIGLGFMISLNITEEGFQLRWGTLQYLGTSCLVLLFLIEFSPVIRLIISGILMLIHQFLLGTWLGDVIYEGIEGGPFGALSWISMLILSSVIAEGLLKDKIKTHFLYGGLICLIISILTYFIWGFSRQRVTLPFLLLTIGTASITFFLLYLLFEEYSKNYTFLQNDNIISMLGKNSFVLYMVHLMLVIFMFYVAELNPTFFIVFLLGLLNTGIIWITGVYLYKKELFITI